MLGDLRVLAVAGDDGELELLLDTERATLQALFDMIRRFKVGYRVELHKRTLERGLLSLIGPATRDVLAGAAPWARRSTRTRVARIEAIDALAIRTDTGIDLLCDARDTEPLAAALLARGATPVGEAAAECLRVERGRPRYGIDLDESVIPQEAGLNDRAVSFTKGCYVGQETVARLFYKGKPNRRLCGLRLSAPGRDRRRRCSSASARSAASAASPLSPSLGPIALALVRREAEPGARVAVGEAEHGRGRRAAVLSRRRDP